MTTYSPSPAASAAPKYVAIADAIAEDIATGRLEPGFKLPPQRDVAYRLQVTLGTVSRAYGELTKRGLVHGEVGRGTYVLFRDGRRGGLVAEVSVDRPRSLVLAAGRYVVRRRGKSAAYEAEIAVREGARVALSDRAMKRVPYSRLARKGDVALAAESANASEESETARRGARSS